MSIMYEKNAKKRYRAIRKKKGRQVKFSDRVHPIKGILSFVFAITGVLILLITAYLSYRSKGNASIWIGLFGTIAFLLTGVGVILSILSLRQKEIHYRFPVLGGVLCALLFISYLSMYLLGAIL
ncbi:MAG: hypothetical protein PWP24_1348 [Clostridiales bacterium]|nr:hypothetical protein [Clostridiales bacterium]